MEKASKREAQKHKGGKGKNNKKGCRVSWGEFYPDLRSGIYNNTQMPGASFW